MPDHPWGRGGSWYGSFEVIHPKSKSAWTSKRKAERYARELSQDGQEALVLTDPTMEGGGTVVARFQGGKRVRKDVLYHVGDLQPRTLSRSRARASETRELREELRVAGFPEDSPVLWLSPTPVARRGAVWEIDVGQLDLARLVPTFQAGGYVLHVGPLPEGAARQLP